MGMNARLPVGTLSEDEILALEAWVGNNEVDPGVRNIIDKMILHGRKYLFHSQIPVEESDCALVVRPWGNEIYITDRDSAVADETRLKLAAAVRDYITDFSTPSYERPKLKLV